MNLIPMTPRQAVQAILKWRVGRVVDMLKPLGLNVAEARRIVKKLLPYHQETEELFLACVKRGRTV